MRSCDKPAGKRWPVSAATASARTVKVPPRLTDVSVALRFMRAAAFSKSVRRVAIARGWPYSFKVPLAYPTLKLGVEGVGDAGVGIGARQTTECARRGEGRRLNARRHVIEGHERNVHAGDSNDWRLRASEAGKPPTFVEVVMVGSRSIAGLSWGVVLLLQGLPTGMPFSSLQERGPTTAA